MALTLLLGLSAGVPALAQTVSPVATPSRAGGVAPLAVFFDGTGTTHSDPQVDPFHELIYEWDFGDPDSGTWPYSGTSRNRGVGPVAAHVYAEPGTYTVRLTVRDGRGVVGSSVTSVNVEDPDAVFAGASTLCFSTTGNFQGCPAGAQQLTTNSFFSVIAQAATGRRLLLRRGETWNSSGRADLNVPGPGSIGAFGDGPAPVVVSTQADPVVRASGRTPAFSDWRIHDLEFQGPGTKGSKVVKAEGTVAQLLLYRLKVTNYHSSVSLGWNIVNYYGQSELHSEVAIVDSEILDANGGSGGYGLYLAVRDVAVLGNRIVDVVDAEHNVRFPFIERGVLSHNFLSSPAPQKHVLKLHAPRFGGNFSFPDRVSRNFVISENTFQGANNDWTAGLGPQDSQNDERVEDGLVERNHFVSGIGTRMHLLLWAKDISVRNNVFDLSGGRGFTAARVEQRGLEPPPDGIRFYNNTCYARDASGGAACLTIAGVALNTSAYNNLLYAPGADPAYAALGNGDLGSNLVVTSNPFVSADPRAPADFALASGSPAIDGGAALVWNTADYSGVVRPIDGDVDGQLAWDVGAFEFGQAAPDPPPAAPVLLSVD